MRRLVARADVFVQNLPPGGRAARARRGPAARHTPELIHVLISGYGSGGPVPRQEGLRPARAVRGRPRLGHRHAGGAVKGRDLDRRHRGWHVRLRGDPRPRSSNGAHRRGAADRGLDAGGPGGVDGLPDVLRGYGGTPPARTGASHATIAPYGPFRAGTEAGLPRHPEPARVGDFCEPCSALQWLAKTPRFSSNSRRVTHRARPERGDRNADFHTMASEERSPAGRGRIANARLRDMFELAEHPQLEAGAGGARWTPRWSTADPHPARHARWRRAGDGAHPRAGRAHCSRPRGARHPRRPADEDAAVGAAHALAEWALPWSRVRRTWPWPSVPHRHRRRGARCRRPRDPAGRRLAVDVGRWAVACHILDFDDLHMEATTHISTVCVPVALRRRGDPRATSPEPG